MQEKIITLATPVFFILIVIELIVGLLRRRNTYRLNDAINSLSLGVLSQVSGVFMYVLRIGIYAWLVERIALFELSTGSVWVWISGVLLYDFCYYWLHRMSHEVNVLWAAHVVHHQSEDYNLSTALRQTSSGALLGWIFYVPMALLGYPIEVFAAVGLVNLLYQFWIHTQQIGRLGWFDRLFGSPSNHRVHHAVNDIYIDKNYGGILMIWDRLFGTFIDEREDECIVYGTRSPLRSWNPLWANLEGYKAIWLDCWRAQRIRDKLKVWFAPPGWHPNDVAQKWPAAPFDIDRPLYDPPLTRAEQAYCTAQFAIVLLVATHFLAAWSTMPLLERATYALWLTAGLWTVGGLMERRGNHPVFEATRLTATAAGVIYSGAWFGVQELPLQAEIAIVAAVAASLLTLCIAFRGRAAEHRYLSPR